MIEGLFVAIDQYNRSGLEKARAVCPAAIAKYRLRMVIAADRAEVPAYRWVRRSRGLDWMTAFGFALGFPGIDLGWLSHALKPRYRLERRR